MTKRVPWWLTFSTGIGLAAVLVVPLVRGDRPFWPSLLLLFILPSLVALTAYRRTTATDRFGLSLYPPLEGAVTVLLYGVASGWVFDEEMPWALLGGMVVFGAVIVPLAFLWNWRKLR